VKNIRSDNGFEFKNLQVEEYLEEEGVKHKPALSTSSPQEDLLRTPNR
jgi:hypothetical protein